MFIVVVLYFGTGTGEVWPRFTSCTQYMEFASPPHEGLDTCSRYLLLPRPNDRHTPVSLRMSRIEACI